MGRIIVTGDQGGVPLVPKLVRETQSQKMARTGKAMRFNKVGPGKRGAKSRKRR